MVTVVLIVNCPPGLHNTTESSCLESSEAFSVCALISRAGIPYFEHRVTYHVNFEINKESCCVVLF